MHSPVSDFVCFRLHPQLATDAASDRFDRRWDKFVAYAIDMKSMAAVGWANIHCLRQ